MSLRFMVVSSATNQVLGSVTPSAWELTETVKSPGSATLTIPVPSGDTPAATERAKAALRRATQPRKRWIAAVDASNKVLWAGPILKPITYAGAGLLNLQLIDWRGWFLRAMMRPGYDGTSRAYKKKVTDQSQLFKDMFRYALNHPKAPPIFIDAIYPTGPKRDLYNALLDRNIGDILDDLQGRDRGAEWWTYGALADDLLTCVPHVAMGFPERTTGKTLRLEWAEGSGGTLAESPTWPESDETFTQVWATGDENPPKQVVTSDRTPEFNSRTSDEILWETNVGPLSGVKKKTTAFEYAHAEAQKSVKPYGTWEVSVADERVDPASYVVGDRARVVLRNAWDSYDLSACRIISRTLSGGRGQASLQKLTVDLADFTRPPRSGRPGVKVDK